MLDGFIAKLLIIKMIYSVTRGAEHGREAAKDTCRHQCITPGRMPIPHLDVAAFGNFLKRVMTNAAGVAGEQQHGVQSGIAQLTANLLFQVFVEEADVKVDVMADYDCISDKFGDVRQDGGYIGAVSHILVGNMVNGG